MRNRAKDKSNKKEKSQENNKSNGKDNRSFKDDLSWDERREASQEGKRDGLQGKPSQGRPYFTPYLNRLGIVYNGRITNIEDDALNRETDLKSRAKILEDSKRRCERDLPRLLEELETAKTRQVMADENIKYIEIPLRRKIAYWSILIPLFAVETPVNAYVLTILQLDRWPTYALAAAMAGGLATLTHLAGKESKKFGLLPKRYTSAFVFAGIMLMLAAVLRTQMVGADETINRIMPALRVNPLIAASFFMVFQGVFMSVGYLLSRSSHAKDADADNHRRIEHQQAVLKSKQAQEAYDSYDRFQHSIVAELGGIECELEKLPKLTLNAKKRASTHFEQLAELYKQNNLRHREDGADPFSSPTGGTPPVDIGKLIYRNWNEF